MTGNWRLYSQTGVDGPEYGIRIRPGYTVVGFQKEDAEAIVAWQNASIRPVTEGDILERSKEAANINYAPNISYDDWQALVRELIAEVEAKNDKIAQDAITIQNLEAALIDGRAQYLLMLRQNPDIAAWDFDEISTAEQDALREQAIESLTMEEPWALIQLRDARVRIKELRSRCQKAEELNKRLEVAFLEAKIGAIMGAIAYGEALGLRGRMDITVKRGEAETEARAALEVIKYGRIERNGDCEAAISSKTRS